MNYFEVLFHPALIMATLLYTLMAISFEIGYQHFLHRVEIVASTHWIVKNIAAPFFHVLLLIAFIYMSYPILFGLEQQNDNLPTLTSLLNSTSGSTMKLVNSLFIISVLLPLVPLLNRFMALILPLQAMAGSALLYSWLASYKGMTYNLIPELKIIALLMFFSIVAEFTARTLAALLARSIRQHHYRDSEKVIYKSILLIIQVPILLIYTLNLS